MKSTYRQCANLTVAAEELKGRGSFKFRCVIAAIAIEAKNKVDIFQEAQKPAKGIQAFQEEVSLHRENCTTEKDGKKLVDAAKFMPLLAKARATHAKAIEAQEKIQDEANKAFDTEAEFNASFISMSLLEEIDKEDPFEVSLLSKLLPFVEK